MFQQETKVSCILFLLSFLLIETSCQVINKRLNSTNALPYSDNSTVTEVNYCNLTQYSEERKKTILALMEFSQKGNCQEVHPYLRKVKSLNLYNLHLTDLSPIFVYTQLHTLIVAKNDLTSLQGIEKLVALEKLDLRDNHIKDLSPLNKLPELQELGIAHNPIEIFPKKIDFSTFVVDEDQKKKLPTEVEPIVYDFHQHPPFCQEINHEKTFTIYTPPSVEAAKFAPDFLEKAPQGYRFVYIPSLMAPDKPLGEGVTGTAYLVERLADQELIALKIENLEYKENHPEFSIVAPEEFYIVNMWRRAFDNPLKKWQEGDYMLSNYIPGETLLTLVNNGVFFNTKKSKSQLLRDRLKCYLLKVAHNGFSFVDFNMKNLIFSPKENNWVVIDGDPVYEYFINPNDALKKFKHTLINDADGSFFARKHQWLTNKNREQNLDRLKKYVNGFSFNSNSVTSK